LSGPELKATLTVEGPIANMDVATGSDLQASVDEWTNRSSRKNVIDYSAVVDFEHLKPNLDEEDDEAAMAAAAAGDNEPLDEKDPEYAEKKRQRREKQREAFLVAKTKREKNRALEQKMVRQDGEPYQVTLKALQEGWYRVCVHGTWYQVSL
jgi:pyruvate/2-oxoglutarate dehydrogenase complex dihydrolipoamide acyltransferase (E2) component